MHDFFKTKSKTRTTNLQNHVKRNFGRDYKGVSFKSLETLEISRQNTKKILFIIKLFLIFIGVFISLATYKKDIQFPIFMAVAILNIYIFLKSFVLKHIRSKFKDEVVIKVIKDINPNLNFFKDDFISKEEFSMSGIFDPFESNATYKGNDLIIGNIDEVNFKMSDIELQEVRGSGKSAHIVTIFKGILFIAEFNKFFTSHTFVVQSAYANHEGKQIKTDNSEFNKRFNIYTNDTINAFYILSPSFMERFIKLNDKFGGSLNAVFFLNRIYIYIDNGKDNFEIDMDMKLTDIVEIFESIKFEFENFFSIIDDLKLNSKIFKTAKM